MSEPAAQQQQSQNGKERSKSTEEKEVPREPALVLKDIDVSASMDTEAVSKYQKKPTKMFSFIHNYKLADLFVNN